MKKTLCIYSIMNELIGTEGLSYRLKKVHNPSDFKIDAFEKKFDLLV